MTFQPLKRSRSTPADQPSTSRPRPNPPGPPATSLSHPAPAPESAGAPDTPFVRLNVGGKKYDVARDTLTKYDSMLRHVGDGSLPCARDHDQRVLLDLDGKTFRHTLNYLRHRLVPPTLSALERDALKAQADALCLAPLSNRLALDALTNEIESRPTLFGYLQLADASFDCDEEQQAWRHHAHVWERIDGPQAYTAYTEHYAKEASKLPGCPWRAFMKATAMGAIERASLKAPVEGLGSDSLLGLCSRAVKLSQQGDHLAAKKASENACAKHTSSVEAHCLLAGLISKSNPFDSASLFLMAVRLRPHSPHANLGHAASLLRGKQFADALGAYEKVLKLTEQWPEAHLGRGESLLGMGRAELALEAFEAALEWMPESPEAHRGCGDASLLLGRGPDAVQAYQAALRCRSDFVEAHRGLGKAQFQQGANLQAVAAFDLALRLQPDDSATHFMRGQALHSLERFHEALGAFETALKYRPHFAQAHFARARTNESVQRWDAALESYSLGLRQQPHAPVEHYRRGIILSRKNQLVEACQAFETAVGQKPVFPEAHHQRGISLLHRKQFPAAKAALDRAIEQEPTFAQALFARGICCENQGLFDAAEEDYDRAIALAPNIATLHHYRGNFLLRQKRPPEALASYDNALALGGDRFFAHLGRCAALCLDGDFLRALDACQQALRQKPSSFIGRVQEAMAFVGLKRLDDAKKSWEEAATNAGKSPSMLETLRAQVLGGDVWEVVRALYGNILS